VLPLGDDVAVDEAVALELIGPDELGEADDEDALEEIVPPLAIVKVAVCTWAAPVVGVTTSVRVCTPSVTFVVSQAVATVTEPPTKSYGPVVSVCVAGPTRVGSSSQKPTVLIPVAGAVKM
jgi:hypothetical protein